MAKKYTFRTPTCECGADLVGKKVEAAGMKGDIPMGYCPDCGKALPLGETESAPEPINEPEPRTLPGEGTGEGEPGGEGEEAGEEQPPGPEPD